MPRLPEFGVFIIGTPGILRNSELEQVSSAKTYVNPVFLEIGERLRPRESLIEFALNGRSLSSGERGCSQAHMGARQAIINSDFDWALVLEDDVYLPENWVEEIAARVSLSTLHPSIVLLNTDLHFNLGPEIVKLRHKPSLANAFLVHRAVLESRPYAWLEKFEIADWPISFADVDFFTVSNLVEDAKAISLIGKRPRSRLAYLMSVLFRIPLLPLSSWITGVPICKLAKWTLLAPIRRDLFLRFRRIRKPSGRITSR